MAFNHPTLGNLDRQAAEDVSVARAHTFELMQFKYDGIWACVYKDDTDLLIKSRNGLLKDMRAPYRFPDGVVLVGEFMFGSQWAQHPQRLGKLFIYDCVLSFGKDVRQEPYSIRYSRAKDILSGLGDSSIELIQSFASTNVTSTVRALERTRAYEGIILRNWDQPYSDVIGRYKLYIEDDFVVMGITEGTGRNTGRLGALVVGLWNGTELVEIMEVGGGFTDIQRQEFYSHAPTYIGRVVRVSGKLRFTSGAFRHPNFLNFRDDKSPRECLFIKQLPVNITE